MNKLYSFFLLIVLGTAFSFTSTAQCPISASATPTSILCGDSVSLAAVTTNPSYIVDADFNDPTKRPGSPTSQFAVGSTSNAVYTNNTCGIPSPDGTVFLWFSTSAVPRNITTLPLDLSDGGIIRFKMRFQTQGGPSGCEGIDLQEEGVALQYANPAVAGGAWQNINYFAPNGGQDPVRTSWTTYTFTIPAAACLSGTQIRWIQTTSSGNDFDNWGLEDIEIIKNSPQYEWNWPHVDNTFRATANTAKVAPIATATYVVRLRNKLIATDTCRATVTVNVQLPTADATATPQTVCKGQPIQLNVESSYNAVLPTTCAVTNLSCNSLNSKANEYQVGTGTYVNPSTGNASGNIFGVSNCGGSKHGQILIRASELIALGFKGGKITTMQMQIAQIINRGLLRNFSIKLKCTNATALTSTMDVAGFSTVAVIPSYQLIVGWNTFTFSSGYDWDGKSNIIIDICWNLGESTTNENEVKTMDTQMPYAALTYECSNGAGGNRDLCGGTNAAFGPWTNRPNIKLGTCEPRDVTLVYNWTGNGMTPALADDKSPVVSSNVAGINTYNVQVYPQGLSQCAVTDNVDVNVLDAPSPPNVLGDTVCQGSSLVLTVNSPISGVTYEWDYPDVGGVANATGTSITRTGVTTAMSGDYKVRGIVTSGNCAGVYATVRVDVRPTPAAPTATPERVCQNQAANYAANTLTGPYRYQWTGPGGYTNNTQGTSINRNPTVAGNYTVIRIDTLAANCNSPVTNFTVIADPLPTVPGLSLNPSGICPGTNFNMAATTENRPDSVTNGGLPSRKTRSVDYSYTYNWTGPTALTNATTPTATTTSVAGTSTYTFVYTRTRRDTTFTYNALGQLTATTVNLQQCSSNPVTIDAVVNAPSISNRTVTCAPDQLGYFVAFDITGGTAPYTVRDGSGAVVAGTFTGNRFESNELPNGPFTLKARDANGCESAVTTGTRDCTVTCLTAIGTMNTANTQKICAANTATAPYSASGEAYDPGDTRSFILHSKDPITDPTNTVYDTRSTTTGFGFKAGMVKGTTYYITAVIGQPNGTFATGYDLGSSCTQFSESAPVVFNDAPTASVLAKPTQVCPGKRDSLFFTFTSTGSGPFDFNYSDGTTTTSRTNKTSGFGDAIFPATDKTYTITQVTDKSTNCTANNQGSATVTMIGAPTAGTVSYSCNAAQDSFSVSFPITGGSPATYIVQNTDGSSAGSVSNAAGIYTFNAAVKVPSGMSHDYKVKDGNSCDSVLVTALFTCSCVSDAGTMQNRIDTLCEGVSTAAGLENADATLDANDIARYVLHTATGGTYANLGTVLDTNSTTVFSFLPGMTYNTTYYISRIVGNRTPAGEVDLNDNCKVITPNAVQVVFLQADRGGISADASICPGDQSLVIFDFNGAGPYDIQLKVGTATQMLTSYLDGDAVYDNLTKTTVYQLLSFTDGKCPGIVTANDSVTITVKPKDNPAFQYTPTVYCKAGTVVPTPTNVAKPGGTYYSLDPQLVIDKNTGVVNIAASPAIAYDIWYVTSECKDSTSRRITLFDTVRTPAISYPQGIYCKDAASPIVPSVISPANGRLTWTPVPSSSNKLMFVGNTNLGRINLPASDAGDYTITYEVLSVAPNPCPSKSVTTSITLNELPTANFALDKRVVCVGDPVRVTYNGSGSNTTTNFVWDMGTAANPRRPTTAGPHTVRWSADGKFPITLAVSDKNTSCSAPLVRDSVQVYAQPIAAFTVSEELPFTTTVPEQHEIIFYQGSQYASTYEWDFGDGTPHAFSNTPDPVSHVYTEPGEYRVSMVATSAGGCTDDESKGTINVLIEGTLYVPNAFSPNDDGFNEFFKPVSRGTKSLEFQVFDRWGELLFTGDQNSIGWDGTFKSSKAPDGVYIYIVKAITYDDKTKNETGVVSLVR